MSNIPKDPIILLSFINTKLRDFYPSLYDACKDLNINENELKNTLANIGYEYKSDKNQFL